MTRDNDGRSYADSMFEHGDPFTGARVGGRPPSGMVITEGPFAQQNPNADFSRREKTAQSSGGGGGGSSQRQAQAITVQTGPAGGAVRNGDVGALVAPVTTTGEHLSQRIAAKIATATDGLGSIDGADNEQGQVNAMSSQVDARSIGGGTPPLQGHDVGKTAPAPSPPSGQQVTKGPGGGTRGPATSAAAKARARAEGRVGKEPVNAIPATSPQAGTGGGREPGGGGAPSVFSGAGDVMKVGGSVADSTAVIVRQDSHPLALFAAIGATLGDEWVEWEPETIQESLTAQTGHDISALTMNKAMALKAVVSHPESFFADWHGFEKICVVFSGAIPHMNLIEDLSPEQMSHGCVCARHLAGKTVEYSDEMKAYVAARLSDAGMVIAPVELGFANRALGALVREQQVLRKTATVALVDALKTGTIAPAAEDDPVAIQVSRALRCHAYVLDRFDELGAQLG